MSESLGLSPEDFKLKKDAFPTSKPDYYKNNSGPNRWKEYFTDQPANKDSFDPEKEVRKIRQAPREEQRSKLQEFKQKLAEQKSGLGFIQDEIIRNIRENPASLPGELMQRVAELGSRFGMTPEQESIAHMLIRSYAEKHIAVRRAREQHPDDKDLYKTLFGEEPKGKIQIIEGPMTLYVRCQNIEDYALIHGHVYLEQRAVTSEDKSSAGKTGGVAIGRVLVPGLEGTIIAENASGLRGLEFNQVNIAIQKHEEEHALTKLFEQSVNTIHDLSEFFHVEFNVESLAKQKQILERHLRIKRRSAEESAKSEILSYSKDGTKPSEIVKHLTKPLYKGGLYDYLSFNIENIREWIDKHIEEPYKKDVANDIADKVFVEEYEAILRESTEALHQLWRIKGSFEQAAAILIQEPLTKWAKVVRRIDENKGSEKKEIEPPTIKSASNFDVLKNAIYVKGGIHGSHRFYKPEEINATIDAVLTGKLTTLYLPRNEGLRDKVNALLISEVKNLEGLGEAIDKTGGLQGSDKFYTPDAIKGDILKVRAGEMSATGITRTSRLREKLIQLLSIYI